MKYPYPYDNYYEHIRYDIIALIGEGPNKILDIGCAAGKTGKKIKDMGKAKEVIGLELFSEIAKK